MKKSEIEQLSIDAYKGKVGACVYVSRRYGKDMRKGHLYLDNITPSTIKRVQRAQIKMLEDDRR